MSRPEGRGAMEPEENNSPEPAIKWWKREPNGWVWAFPDGFLAMFLTMGGLLGLIV
ncbi:MAG: hypothetical protein ABIS18_06990 [Actinomycetota bacterium]